MTDSSSQSAPRMWFLEIPAIDVHRSASFYENVFYWKIRNRETSRPKFDGEPGCVSGAWVTRRPISTDPGLLDLRMG
jgi:uncharacterized protein